VPKFPQAIAAATAAGLYSLAGGPGAGGRASAGLRLAQNTPNPFSERTLISYSLRKSSRVRVLVQDIHGRRIGVLSEGLQSAGEHAVRYDASGLSNGVYYYRLEAEGTALTRPFVVLR